MMPAHHPSDAMLMDYASGNLPEAPALVVATHVALCPGCRKQVGAYEALGGALIEGIDPVPLAAGALDAVLARLDEPDAAVPARPRQPSGAAPLLPEPLRSYAGGDLPDLRWRKVAPGIEAIRLPVGGMRTRLLRVRGGITLPRHAHGGLELMLILAGAIRSEGCRFARGDLSVSGPAADHAPAAETGQPCVCLLALEGPVRLTGPIGRWLNPFIDI